MNDLNSETWNSFRKFGYRCTAVTNGVFALAAYSGTYAIQKKYGKWKKMQSLISPISILGRSVTAGFICIGVSSWLSSYYCFNGLHLKSQDVNRDTEIQNLSNHHIFALKSSVLLFSISTYYCIGLMSTMKIQKIDIPDIDLHLVEISPTKFVITGSILASLLAIPTSLVFVDWIKDCFALYNGQ